MTAVRVERVLQLLAKLGTRTGRLNGLMLTACLKNTGAIKDKFNAPVGHSCCWYS